VFSKSAVKVSQNAANFSNALGGGFASNNVGTGSSQVASLPAFDFTS
jgi:hypothetical protein